MVVNNLLAIRYRKYILTTNSRHDYPVYVNCGCPFVHGLRAGVRLASAGVEGHGVGKGASGDHSHAVAEDRRPGACECAARLPGDGGELPLGEFVRAGSRESAGSRAGLRSDSATAPISSRGLNAFPKERPCGAAPWAASVLAQNASPRVAAVTV